MAEKNEYNWTEDPFKDDPDVQKGMSKGSKTFVGCGCLIALGVLIFLAIGIFDSFLSLVAG